MSTGQHAHSATLCLPRAALDAHLIQALRAAAPATLRGDAAPAPPNPGWLAHGPLVLQPGWDGLRLLVAELLPGAPRRLPLPPVWAPPPAADALAPPPPCGLALVYVAAPDEAPPPALPASLASQAAGAGMASPLPAEAVQQAWSAFFARAAPEYRLACTALMPDLVLLWLRRDGLLRLGFRPGDAWAALQAGRATPPTRHHHGWQALQRLDLPGADLLSLDLGPDTDTGIDIDPVTHRSPLLAPPAARLSGAAQLVAHGDHTSTPSASESTPEPDTEGRFSRQAGALGLGVLQRLQRSRIALVGSGRIGSALAHSLVRMGCSLLVIEPDTMSAHSLDGDLAPLHEGRPKVQALKHQLRGLLRPGATLDVRMLPVASPAAGTLLADADLVLCCVDNDAARLWTNAWALALLKPLLTIATAVTPQGAEAELRLLPPATGCLSCCGGFAQVRELATQLALPGPVPTPADFRQQRAGSLRSWNMIAAHAGLRLLEHLAAGRVRGALFRRLIETPDGGLQVQDWSPQPARRDHCPLCRRLGGAGLAAVRPGLLAALARQAASKASGGSAP